MGKPCSLSEGSVRMLWMTPFIVSMARLEVVKIGCVSKSVALWAFLTQNCICPIQSFSFSSKIDVLWMFSVAVLTRCFVQAVRCAGVIACMSF